MKKIIAFSIITLIGGTWGSSDALAACNLKRLGFGKNVVETAKKYRIPEMAISSTGDSELNARGSDFCAEFPEGTLAKLIFREGKFVQVEFTATDSGTTIYDIVNGQISKSLKKPDREKREEWKKKRGGADKKHKGKKDRRRDKTSADTQQQDADKESSRSGFQDMWSDKKNLMGGYSTFTNTDGKQVESLVITSRKYQKILAKQSQNAEAAVSGEIRE